MLILSRQRGEEVLIGDDIVVRVVDIRGDKVRLGFDAPASVHIDRAELRERIDREGRRAAPGSDDPILFAALTGLNRKLRAETSP